MHCRTILPLTLAALLLAADPALSQRVPLILDQTIELPRTSNVWDVMPHPNGYYVWVQARAIDSAHAIVYWGRFGIQDIDSFEVASPRPTYVACFLFATNEPAVILAGSGGDSLSVRMYSLTDGSPFGRRRFWRLTGGQWPPTYWWLQRYFFVLGTVIVPPPPDVSSDIVLVVSSTYEGHTVGSWGSLNSYSHPADVVLNMLEEDSSVMTSAATRMAWSLTGLAPVIAFSTYSHTYGSSGGVDISYGSTGISSYTIEGDSFIGHPLLSDNSVTCSPPLACTEIHSSGEVVVFSRICNNFGGIRSSAPNRFEWMSVHSYTYPLAADVVSSNGDEEFLGYDESRRVFDVYAALDGTWYGTTDSIDIPPNGGIRLLGRYDSTFRRLVICDSTSLKLYRFGEYLAADEHPAPIPSDLSLTAYPNPFNPSTTIRFTLPRRGEAELVVFDVTGRQVSVLVEGVLATGEHLLPFDGARLPSGIYFARLTTAGAQATQKLLLLR